MNERHSWEVYPGKKRKYNWLTWIAIVVGILAVSLLLLFLSFQKYLVYRQDGVYLDMPFLGTEVEEVETLEGVVREPVQAELKLDGYDFSNVKTNAGEGINVLKAMYVPAADINDEKLAEYQSRAKLNKAKALVLQVKPESGQLVYPSQAKLAVGYGLGGTYDLAKQVLSLKEQGLYMVADVSCLLDSTIVTHYASTALKSANGAVLVTEAGCWMDPYNPEYREYLVEVCKELINMGFDEIMLSYVSHPEVEGVLYTQSMSTPPDPASAISSFSIYMERELGDMAPIGLRCSANAIANGKGKNGQDMEVLGKVYDRLYCATDKNIYDDYLNKALGYMHTTDTDRFVHYGYSAFTDNSWMLLTWVDPDKDKKQ